MVYFSVYFGWGIGFILYDDVVCMGFEVELLNCYYFGLGINDCGYREDVGVKCGKEIF